MITIERSKTVGFHFLGVPVDVNYNVMTGAEVIGFDFKASDADGTLVQRFVNKVYSSEIDGWQNGITGKQLLDIPGSKPLINDIVNEIVKSSLLSGQEKN